jgi:hypothetical protein
VWQVEAAHRLAVAVGALGAEEAGAAVCRKSGKGGIFLLGLCAVLLQQFLRSGGQHIHADQQSAI